jgi:transketolase
MDKQQKAALEQLALKVREHIIHMATDGGCFIGASLSCTDLIVYLYSRVVRLTPQTLTDPQRDYVLLSKGHDVPALYGTLAELGFFEPSRLRNHLSPHDFLYWHPNRAIPGIEFHSGSLGHLLAVGMGIALDIKIRGDKNKVYVILGDGELNEGSIWEAALVAAGQQLTNLVAIVDRNGFQANLPTEELVPIEPLEDKFKAFKWHVQRVNGHDFDALDLAFQQLTTNANPGPSVIIADTVRGKGLPSIESRADRWFVNFTHEEVDQLLAELYGRGRADLTSEKLIVR